MFKFLRNKLKKFEDKLEAELEAEFVKEKELSKTSEPIEQESVRPDEESLASDEEDIVTSQPEEISLEKPVIEEKKEELPQQQKTPRVLRRRGLFKEKQKREQEIDKQIEKTIETELEHTLRARKSIEQVVKTTGRGTWGISDEKLEDLLWDLEIGLLESDVAYSVIESIKNDIKQELRNISVDRSKIGEVIEEILRNAIAHVLTSTELDFNDFIEHTKKPIVIMFVGVNGSGKTLSIAKIATLLKKHGKSCVMAAGDTFRAGAIEQLGIHADKVGVKIIKHGPGSDPAAVAYDAIEHAKAKHKDVVLLDTAGRMQTNVNLMDEMAKIKRVAKPDLILFVGDALAGNDAVEQAKRFNEIVGIDGVILTKVDTDAKGGSALSVAYTIGKPLLFIGIGQGYDDQIPFDPQWMIDNIFDKG
ncbi:MAG: signal recognition particle-docking protein FtsY [Candidatus Thermoplasmatota archaeon]|nr:signal recognition particle-docking protein FtsY [Candidatus Thermoplasmatota archaeon]